MLGKMFRFERRCVLFVLFACVVLCLSIWDPFFRRLTTTNCDSRLLRTVERTTAWWLWRTVSRAEGGHGEKRD